MSAATKRIETPRLELPESIEVSIDWNHPHQWFKRKVWHRLASAVPDSSYTETSQIFPLQRDTSKKTIARCVRQFNDGDYSRTDGVYVLECFIMPVPPGSALANQVSCNSLSRYHDLGDPRRVLYVGVSENVPRRIHQHLNDPSGRGANFTAIFYRVRLLQVGWFRNYARAERAEKLTAKFLEMRFPTDYVAQPG